MQFFEQYLRVLKTNLFNDYKDNWDYSRYGAKRNGLNGKIKETILGLLNRRGYFRAAQILNIESIKKFEYLYNHLESNEDKELLLQVLAYRVLGYKKVKLPHNNPGYWNQLKSLDELKDDTDFIDPKFQNFFLHKISLDKIGYPIQFYFLPEGIMSLFILKQYEYNKNGVVIKANKEDYVLDCGGCWGDTALYFANEVGINGKVYSFEFIPNNVKIFEKNISLNKSLAGTIEQVSHPVWNDSKTKLYFMDCGPASQVSLSPIKDMDGECTTISIDDFVAKKDLKKIDFIKMDIEGAENNALCGAVETIKKFKPKLAISLYHSVEDFERIPLMIKEMVPSYKFYFSHCTINIEESLLFAKV